jgi:hypothetical protein
MVEYGLLSRAASGFATVQAQIDAALADGATRWILIAGGVLLGYWLIRRR